MINGYVSLDQELIEIISSLPEESPFIEKTINGIYKRTLEVINLHKPVVGHFTIFGKFAVTANFIAVGPSGVNTYISFQLSFKTDKFNVLTISIDPSDNVIVIIAPVL